MHQVTDRRILREEPVPVVVVVDFDSLEGTWDRCRRQYSVDSHQFVREWLKNTVVDVDCPNDEFGS